ncbi:MAG: magnesium transporter [Planctomycetota bacterium]
MRNPLLAPEVRELLQEGRTNDLLSVLQEMHPTDAAAILSALEDHEVAAALSLLPLQMERDVFGYLEPDVQEHYVLGAGRDRVRQVLLSMLSDDRAEFLERFDERVRSQLISMLPSAACEDLRRRSTFREDQVGSFLSTDYAVLNPSLTARTAIAELRRQAPGKETIYYSYVVDKLGKAVGFCSLRDLILARDDQPISEIMKTDIVTVTADADQEVAAKIIRDYDLLALPVVDADGRLVGIVTHDDAVDIVEEEAAEDLAKMAGVTGDNAGEDFLAEPVWKQVRRRAPVICLLALFWLFTATIIKGFEKELAGNSLLIALLPMVMAIGGMVGSQASTLIVRAISTTSMKATLWVVLWKELRVSFALAAILAGIAFINAWLLQRFTEADRPLDATLHIAFVIAIAMSADVLFAAALGAAIPYFVKVMRIDPALISTPAVTALTDLTGASIYLVVVTLLLNNH